LIAFVFSFLFFFFFLRFMRWFFGIFIYNPKKVPARKWQVLHTILHTSYHLYDIWEHKHIFNYIGICYFDFERFENETLKLSFILSPRATLDVFTKKNYWISSHFNIARLLFTRKLGIFGFNLSNALRNSVLEPFLFTFWLLLCFCLFFSFFFEIYEMVFWALN
jgi:hypothetical protein